MNVEYLMLAVFGMPGWAEVVVIAAVGLLIFGRRLPEVGRSLGRGIVEFKKGLRGIEDEIEDASRNDQPDRYKTLNREDRSTTRESRPPDTPTND